MEVIYTVPQRIFRFNCDEDLIDDTLLLLKDEEYDYKFVEDNKKDPTSTLQTSDNRLNKRDEYRGLHLWVTDCMNEVKDHLDLLCDEIKIVQSWGNRSEYDQWHRMHWHPNSYMSSVLYFADTEQTSPIFFEIDDLWSGQGANPFLVLDKPEQGRKNLQYPIECEKGQLIIFPSGLRHGVGSNQSQEPRYSMSFNGFPCGNVGQWQNLYAMEIDIL